LRASFFEVWWWDQIYTWCWKSMARRWCIKIPTNYLTSPEDKPLDIVPTEIFTSDKYETYYNVCWFDGQGTLQRCKHSYHRTEENATYCKYAGLEHTIIGKVLEQR
jgi:hypothetical protein